jgi:hypothetical protein
MYAMVATMTDISFAVSTVSQYMSKAGPLHWMVVRHIIRYLKSTLDFKLCLRGKDIAFRGFCDAEWGRRCKRPAINYKVRVFCWH